MPINVRFAHGGLGVVYECTGALTGRDFIQANRRLLAAPDRLGGVRYGLVDLTDAEGIRISRAESRMITAQDMKIAEAMPRGAAVAVVAALREAYDMAHLWQVSSQRTGWATMRLRTRDEARSWIALEIRRRFDIDLEDDPNGVDSRFLPHRSG